jgi:hypothetical protein
MLDLPKIDREEKTFSDTSKIKKVLVGLALAVGVSVTSVSAEATTAPSLAPAIAVQQSATQADSGSLLLSAPTNVQTTQYHYSHSSHRSHSSHYSSRW